MSKYQKAKEDFKDYSFVINKTKAYEVVQLPSVESTGVLKSISEIANTCQLSVASVERHIGGTYTHKDTLHRHLTTICEFIHAGKLSEGQQELIIDKLQEGAPYCTPGFMNRVQECILGLKRPQNMSQLLALYRRRLVEKARAPVSSEIHANQRFFVVANEMGLAIPDQGVQDAHAGAVPKGVIQAHINRVFCQHYTPERIERDLFSSIFSSHGYRGRIDTGEGYKYGMYDNVLKSFTQLIGNPNIGIHGLFIVEEDEFGDDIIADINMQFVAAEVRENLFQAGVFTKHPVDHKQVFTAGGVELCVDKRNTAKSVFRVTGDDGAERFFYVGDAHEFVDSIPGDLFRSLSESQRLNQAVKDELLVLGFLQGLVVNIDAVKALLPRYLSRNVRFSGDVDEILQHVNAEGRMLCLTSMLENFGELELRGYVSNGRGELISYLVKMVCDQVTDARSMIHVAFCVSDASMTLVLDGVVDGISDLVCTIQDFCALFRHLSEENQVTALTALTHGSVSFINQFADLHQILAVLKGSAKDCFIQMIRPKLGDIFPDERGRLLANDLFNVQATEVDLPDSTKRDLRHVSGVSALIRCLRDLDTQQKMDAISYISDRLPDVVNGSYDAKQLFIGSLVESKDPAFRGMPAYKRMAHYTPLDPCHVRQMLLCAPRHMVSQIGGLCASDFIRFWQHIEINLRKDFLRLIPRGLKLIVFERLTPLHLSNLLKGCDVELAQSILKVVSEYGSCHLNRLSSYVSVLNNLPRELWSVFSQSVKSSLKGSEFGAYFWREELKGMGKSMAQEVFLIVPDVILSSIAAPLDIVRLANIVGIETLLGQADVFPTVLKSVVNTASKFSDLFERLGSSQADCIDKVLSLLMPDLFSYVRSAQDIGLILRNLDQRQGLSVLIVLMASPDKFVCSLNDLRIVFRSLPALQQDYFCRVIESRLSGLFQGGELLEARRYLGLPAVDAPQLAQEDLPKELTRQQYVLLDEVESVDQLLAALAQILHADRRYAIKYLNNRMADFIRDQGDLFRLLDFLGERESSAVFLYSPGLVYSLLFSMDYAGFYGLFKRATPYWQERMVVILGDALIDKLIASPVESLRELLMACDDKLVQLIMQQLDVDGHLVKIIPTPEQVLLLTAEMDVPKKQSFFAVVEKSSVLLHGLATAEGEGEASAVKKAAADCLRAGSARTRSLYQSVDFGLRRMEAEREKLRIDKERRIRHIKLAAGRVEQHNFFRDLEHFNQDGERVLYLQTLGRKRLEEMLRSRFVSSNRSGLYTYRADFLAAYIAIREAESGKYLLTTHLSTIFRCFAPAKEKKLKIARSLLDRPCKRTFSGGLLGLVDCSTRASGIRA